MSDISVAVVSTVESLLGQATLNVDSVFRLRNAVHNSITEHRALQNRLNALDSETISRDEKAVRLAVFNWIFGRNDLAENALKALSGSLVHVLKGCIALNRHRFDEAIKELSTAAQSYSSEPKVAAELSAAFRQAGKTEEALKIAEKASQNDTEVLLQKGWALATLGYQEQACAHFEKSIELDPKNAQATFRLAYYMDLRGEDLKAIELYRKVTGQGSAFVNAMINLGLLLEDRDDYDNAIACMKEALKADPTNRRAALYLRDAVESLDMYYDEGQRKETDRLDSILRIPINDFELSVRSRNCLAKMNVKNLSDIVKKSEPELMAYKNFGETSLREIKQLLESKGLRLGMQKEDEQKRVRTQRLRLGSQENALMTKPIADLALSVRARKCMQRLNIETIGDLCEKSESDLLSTKNFGQTSLTEIKQKLQDAGLGLKIAD